MKRIILILVALNISTFMIAQNIIIDVQNPVNNKTDQFYESETGIVTWFEKSDDWIFEEDEQTPYNYVRRYKFKHNNTYAFLISIPDETWKVATLAFIDQLDSNPGGEKSLFVYVGHNVLLDIDIEFQAKDCYDNMLFTSNSDIWSGVVDNTKVSTSGSITPSGHSIYPAIMSWLNGEDEYQIRKAAAEGYSNFQNIGIIEANELFNLK